MTNGNISGGRIKRDLKSFICNSPFLHGVLSNPFAISILILTAIWLLDMLYGKSFECASPREILQHSTTGLFVMSAGIFLNNLAVAKCDQIEGGQTDHKDPECYDPEPSDNIHKYDSVLSQYE